MGNLHALTDLETLEVSLVRRGANKKRIAITKSDSEENKQMDEMVEAVLGTELDNEAEVEEVLKKAGLSPKAMAATKAALKLLNAFKDEPGVSGAMSKLAGFKATAKGGHEDEDDKPAFLRRKKAEEMGLTEETQTKLDSLWKADQKKVQAEIKKANDERDELRKALDVEKDSRVLKECVTRAAAMEHIGKSDEVGAILKSVGDLSPEIGTKVEELLVTANKAIETGKIFDEAGNVGSEASSDDAWGAIDKAAKELVAKSDGKITHPAAVVNVMQNDKELYAAHHAEKRN